jgi:beta-lactam-binding protein with PASTA domain
MVVSEGPASVSTPDVVGQNYAAARSMLEQVGLVVGEVQYDSTATAPRNSVIAQTPAAAESVARGTRVSLKVSGTAP